MTSADLCKVLLDNGNLRFAGNAEDFAATSHRQAILDTQNDPDEPPENDATPKKAVNKLVKAVRDEAGATSDSATSSESESSSEEDSDDEEEALMPRKLIEDEARAVGHVNAGVWLHLIRANGGVLFWLIFVVIFVGAQLSLVGQNLWLRCVDLCL